MASRDFGWRLFKNKLSCESAPDRGPEFHLAMLFTNLLPGFRALFELRHRTDELLRESYYIADLAFISGVWRYHQIISLGMLQKGFAGWPPPADWRTEPAAPVAVLADKNTVDAETPVVPVVAKSATKHVPMAAVAPDGGGPAHAVGEPSDSDGPEVADAGKPPHFITRWDDDVP